MATHEYRLTDEEFMAVSQRLDELVQEFETLPLPVIQEKAFEMLQAIDALHREGLSRLIGFLREQEQDAWVDQAAEDPVVQALLLLYDLAPVDSALAAQMAVDEGAADANGRTPARQQRFISLNEIQLAQPLPPDLKRPAFQTVARLDELPPGAMQAVALDEVRALVINVGGDVYAVGELCPGSDLPLSFGTLDDTRLTCPWHNEVYDVRSGKCLEAAGRLDKPRLAVYPVTVTDAAIQIAVSVPT